MILITDLVFSRCFCTECCESSVGTLPAVSRCFCTECCESSVGTSPAVFKLFMVSIGIETHVEDRYRMKI